MKFEFHPLLSDVPLMPLHERDALANDISENGQYLPIIAIGKKIIDGRNRYLACRARGIEPLVIDLIAGKDPKKAIASLNYFRKHWTTQERAHFAALMSLESERGNPETKPESNTANAVIPSITQSKAAKQMGVSVSSVKREKAKIKGKTNGTAKIKQPTTARDSVDSNGKEIPEAAIPYWNRKSEVTDLANAIHAVKRKIEGIPKNDPMYCEVSLSGVIGDLNSANNRLRAARVGGRRSLRFRKEWLSEWLEAAAPPIGQA